MDWFKFINDNYKDNFYNKEDVKVFVKSKKITIEQYFEITNEQYA